MAKQVKKPECKDYAGVEQMLVRMNELDIRLADIGVQADEIVARAQALRAKGNPLLEERKGLAGAIEKFIKKRKGRDFTGEGESLRSKAFKGGVVAVQRTPEAIAQLSRDWRVADSITAIEELMKRDSGWFEREHWIKIKKELDKGAIKADEPTKEELAQVGLRLKSEDKIHIKTNHQVEREKAEKDAADKRDAA